MRLLIIVLFIAALGFLTWQSWQFFSTAQSLRNDVTRITKEIGRIDAISSGLSRFKTAPSEKVVVAYLNMYNRLQGVAGEFKKYIQIAPANAQEKLDLNNLAKPSEYLGVMGLDVVCKIDLKTGYDGVFLERVNALFKKSPVELLGINKEGTLFDITFRVYGV